ncbi:MAG: signal peptidase I, partial [Bacteroidetes bacterium]
PSFWKPEKGDVIVFIFPGYRDEVQSAEFTYYLKRCVATGGDTLEVRNRVVYVNGVQSPFPKNMKFNSSIVKPKGIADEHIFPPGAPFNEDNYGPIVIPKKGMVIPLTASHYNQWKMFIKREQHNIEVKGGAIMIDGKSATSYTVERNYVFGMGDNRDNSLDSRFWGFIPEEDVVGTPLIVYWSWDPDLALFNIFDKISTVRWDRVGTLVD